MVSMRIARTPPGPTTHICGERWPPWALPVGSAIAPWMCSKGRPERSSPYEPVAHTLEVVHHVVHHPVAERSELAPVGGVEGLFADWSHGRKVWEERET